MLHEIALLIDSAQAEALSDALLDIGALAVSIEDAEADTAEEQPLYGEPGLESEQLVWRSNRLLVLLPAGADPQQLLAAAADTASLPVPAIQGRRQVEDADWVRLSQAQFPPTQIGALLWIVPTWHDPPEPSALNIRLDPGVAFGTGTHATTQLCLRWLLEHSPAGQRVLDYGCGSGVLAIAAGLLGAMDVAGTDIDEQALVAARANSARNAVIARYTTPDELPPGPFDIVLANILANPLKVLAPALLGRVGQRGALILCGVLQRQAEELIAVYRAADPKVPLTVWAAADGWVCLYGHRTS